MIVLRPGRYPRIAIGPGARGITLRGPGASTRFLRISRSSRIRVVGVAVSSRVEPESRLDIVRSRRVRIDRVAVTGRARSPARLRLRDAGEVKITQSAFARCGDHYACILLGRSSGVRIARNTFDDCAGCDFVRGRVRTGLAIRDNLFGSAVTGDCWARLADPSRCNHQDLIQIQAGRDIVVERNRLGVQENGAAQLYLTGPLARVIVRNNVFQAASALRPEWISPVGIAVGNSVEQVGPPTGVVIAHNTILSGAPHQRGSDSSISLSPLYAELPVALQPIVVNNVLASVRTADWLCGRTQLMSHNVIADGTACSAADVVGDPVADAVWGVPGPASPLVDAGAPGWATYDVDRALRDASPDVGAYEVPQAGS